MLTKRKIEIFKAIVEEFIQTAEPAGSKTLMEKYGLPYSSATIRNEMIQLEELGLIEKTHISSGRVPSTSGYRFYVEHLMEKTIEEEFSIAVQSIFDEKSSSSEDIIRKTCDILSSMTNMTSLVLGPDAHAQRLKHIQVFPIDETSAVAVFITDSGHTENRVFQFPETISSKDIQTCLDILNKRLTGTVISEVVEKMHSIKPLLKASIERSEILFQAFMSAFMKIANENIYYSGQNNLLYQPEFADVEKIKKLMLMLEDSQVWRDISLGKAEMILKTDERSQLVWLNDVAVVSSTFKLGNNEEAQLMLVGPSRMEYNKVVSLIQYLADCLETMYKKGGL